MILPLLLALLATTETPSPVTVETMALIVASNTGHQVKRPPLRYADDDAAKYYQVFRALAGDENVALLTSFDGDTARLFPALVDRAESPTRAGVRAAAERLGARSVRARAAGARVRFYFVFAGHGDVDAGRGFLALPDGPLDADDVHGLVAALGADESHVILDSCNSYFVVNPRRPGGRRVPTPEEAARSLAGRVPHVGLFLSTSAGGEVFEWSELQSGVFSHAVRSGLLGAADADRDGRVSYAELAAFVETATAAIRNPQYRPRVFARGPDGEAGRAILELPRTLQPVLRALEPQALRLAVRDGDGLRWVDVHQEPAQPLEIWLPTTLAPGLEVERLRRSERGEEVEQRYALPPGAREPVALASLAPLSAVAAARGTAEIFRDMFARPFGPQALAAYQEEQARAPEPVFELPAEEGSRPPPLRWYFEVGYDFGFTRAARVPLTDGSLVNVAANGGTGLLLGASVLPVAGGRLRTLLAVGMKTDGIDARNGSVRFWSFPVEVGEVAQLGPAQLAAGASLAVGPRIRGAGNGAALGVSYRHSLGLYLQAAYAWKVAWAGATASLGPRLTWQKLEVPSTGEVLGASALGLRLGLTW